jgi:hypothetical protein
VQAVTISQVVAHAYAPQGDHEFMAAIAEGGNQSAAQLLQHGRLHGPPSCLRCAALAGDSRATAAIDGLESIH